MLRKEVLWSIYNIDEITISESTKGDIFETLSHIAIITKGLFNYSSIWKTYS